MNTTPALSQALQQALHYYQHSQWAQAESLYRSILHTHPTHAEALNMLGLCRVLQGDVEQAIECIQKSSQLAPKEADYANNLGNLFLQKNDLAAAQGYFQRALKLNPKLPSAHLNLGVVLKQQDDLGGAVKALRKAVKWAPQYAKAWYTLGTVYLAQKQFDVARTALQKALRLEPHNADALNAMGGWYKAQKQPEQARQYYHKALKARPDFAEVYVNLGLLWEAEEDYAHAIQAYKTAMTLKPDAKVACTLGNLLCQKFTHLQEAEDYFQQAIALEADYILPYDGLVSIKMQQADIHGALDIYRTVLEINPTHRLGWLSYLYLNHYVVEHPEALLAMCQPLKAHYPAVEYPLEHKLQHCQNPQRRLRLAYISNDFRDHSVAYFMQAVLAQHDSERFEVFCYHRHFETDDMTVYLRGLVDHWQEFADKIDAECVQHIRRDQIDILVDLSGYTSENVLSLLTQKPAPLQMEYLGYPGTSGLPCIDYRVVDVHTEPPASAQQFSSESLLYMPDSYFCYQPPALIEQVPVAPLPAVNNGFITFGSFNNAAKLSDKTIEYWSAILRAVPTSRLLLKSKVFSDIASHALFHQRFALYGIAPERLIFKGRTPDKQAHFELYQDMDIALDTYPYNGATTTCEALWMGVPVLSLNGATHASRMGLSILHTLGKAEWVCTTPQDFIHKAVELAEDVEHLQALRGGLRDCLRASPLMQAERFTRALEGLYQQTWADFCAKAVQV